MPIPQAAEPIVQQKLTNVHKVLFLTMFLCLFQVSSLMFAFPKATLVDISYTYSINYHHHLVLEIYNVLRQLM